jgi:hypothetical protein
LGVRLEREGKVDEWIQLIEKAAIGEIDAVQHLIGRLLGRESYRQC